MPIERSSRMSQLDPRVWALVSPLIDQALDLPRDRRRDLLDALPHDPDAAALLRRLLSELDRLGATAFGGDLELLEGATLQRAVARRTITGPEFTGYAAGDTFAGTPRYEVLRVLGSGGMGVVYEVRDRLRDDIVALKTFRRASPHDLLRLKSEFRALADIAHDNLVCLYDLVADDATCFFTMERVYGVDVVAFLSTDTHDTSMLRSPLSPASRERVRRVLRQLVEGVLALHERGTLHRDIKPANVLVTPRERVVILDFGLAMNVGAPSRAGDLTAAGTPAYISPERSAGAPPSEAADWYSVGVTLFETLVRARPRVRAYRSGTGDPSAHEPSLWNDLAAVPQDLAAICVGLLNPDPRRRLTGRDVLARLAGVSAALPDHGVPRAEARFVGRAPQRSALHRALASAASGHASTAFVSGPSGIGKSALVRQFARELDPAALCLHGRCYAHEALPYNAVDGTIDQLSRYLSSLAAAEVAGLLPSDARALARLFPVLRQVPSVAAMPGTDVREPDVVSLRRLAFGALQELLRRIASRRPLVLCFDDLQWADADSRALLDEIFRSPRRAPLLAIGCFRSEETARNPWLQSLVADDGVDGCWSMLLDPLGPEEARDIIIACVPPDVCLHADLRDDMVRVAAGSPLLLEQFAQEAAAGHLHRPARGHPEALLRRRIDGLPADLRSFVETLAVCARPMHPTTVGIAAGLSGDERRTVARLRASHLIRSGGSADLVEVYHDRIRECITGELSPDRTRDVHHRVMRALEQRDAEDAEALFDHARGAGESSLASAYAQRAGTRALDALAFDRAASYFRAALAASARPSSAVLEQLGSACTSAGRPAEAADAFLRAAQHESDPDRELDLRRRAGEQLLLGGQIDRAFDVLASVLDAGGMRLAAGPWTGLISLVWSRLRLRVKGFGFTPVTAPLLPRVALRLDTYWTLATGLSLVDPVRGADFNLRYLLAALSAGDPRRLARALLIDKGFHSAGVGAGLQSRAHALLTSLAPHVEDRECRPLAALSDGVAALMDFRWKAATTHFDRMLTLLEHHRGGSTWERNLAHECLLGAHLCQGHFTLAEKRARVLLLDARERGNAFLETELAQRCNLLWLVADRPDEGERLANEALAKWSQRGFHRQHYNHRLASIQTALYRGQAEQAWQLVQRAWPQFRRHLMLLVPYQQTEARAIRARCALLMASERPAEAAVFLRIARRMQSHLARDSRGWPAASAALIGATLDYQVGDRSSAIRGLYAAAALFDSADMQLYAWATRWRLGALLSPNDGRALVAQAVAWAEAESVKNPRALFRWAAPGLPAPPSS